MAKKKHGPGYSHSPKMHGTHHGVAQHDGMAPHHTHAKAHHTSHQGDGGHHHTHAGHNKDLSLPADAFAHEGQQYGAGQPMGGNYQGPTEYMQGGPEGGSTPDDMGSNECDD